MKTKTTFTVHHWQAALWRLKNPQPRGPVRSPIRKPSISGTAWPTEAIAISERPRVLHNQQRA